jgi:DMSO reductase family type II enzyme molybdopterin subunit
VSGATARRWAWDRVTWSTHCANCLANCAYHLYLHDGRVVVEEASGDLPGYEGVPDPNPLGCQKGAAWQTQLTNGERLLHPLRRVGERGSGRWERVSWDDALDEIADAIIDALEVEGPHSVLVDEGAEGGVLTAMAKARLVNSIDAVAFDSNSTVGDVHLGQWLTFGTLLGGSGADDTFRAEVVLVWNGNPAFTRIPYFHYLTEARYHGATVVLIAPDYSPSAIHADLFVSVEPGTDAALALAMCRVILDEGLADLDFVRAQTDLPLLVTPEGRFLRESDLHDGGRDDRFYAWAAGAAVAVDATRLARDADGVAFDLDGHGTVRLVDGSKVEVRTVLAVLRERLAGYAPEDAARVTGVHPDTIRTLARLVASKRTKLQNGLGACKHHHGDLMERAMLLVLALTGNWGAPGTGLETYIIALLEGEVLGLLKTRAGVESAEQAIVGLDALLDGLKASDPAMTDGKAVQAMMRLAASAGTTVPPAFWLYYHAGFDEIWARPGYDDGAHTIADYLKEAQARGWWSGLARPEPDVTPRVLIQAGTNTLRRTRGGQRQLLRHVWPSLDLVVLVDWRMNSAGLHADLVLPAACEAERIDLHAANSQLWDRTFSDRALEPAGETRSDYQIFQGIARAISRRAAERGLEDFGDGRGGRRRYADVIDSYTVGGALESDEAALDEVVRDSALSGNLPAGTSVSTLRETGWVRPVRLPRAIAGATGSEIDPHGPFVALRDQTERGVPFATLTGRAQFCIDHPWFVEADEALPRHKDAPAAGGDHPLVVTGGHPRWSMHATNTTNRFLLETTRGHPVVHLHPADAAARGVTDDALVRVFNDVGEYRVHAKLSPAVRPGQVILYASWEPYLFPDWSDGTLVEPGMIKGLHFAAGYGHLAYSVLQWQPQQSDRVFRVDVEQA